MNIIQKINNPRTNKCRIYFDNLILSKLEDLSCWIAGGSIRSWYANEKITDIDIFFPNGDQFTKAFNRIINDGGEVVFENNNVIKIKYNNRIFDFIKKYFDSIETTLNNFDFTVTIAAIDRENSYFGDSFFMDLSSKRLAIDSLPFPESTLFRLQKYHRKGYWICKEELYKIVIAIKDNSNQEEINKSIILEDIDTSSGSDIFAGID